MPKKSVECEGCKIGELTPYAPVFRRSPEQTRAHRKDVAAFRAHQIIQRAGEAPSNIYVLRSGWAYRAVHFEDGRRQILSFLTPGDLFCCEAIRLPDYRLPYSVQTLTDVSACVFDFDKIGELLQGEEARHLLAVEFQHQQTQIERRLVDVGRRRAIGRLSRLVLDLYSRLHARGLAHGDDFDFPLRQADMADALGLTSEHVGRTLIALRSRGALEIHHGRAHILDRALLTSIADIE